MDGMGVVRESIEEALAMADLDFDPEAFNAFEREGWATPSVAHAYAAILATVTSQSISALFDAAGVRAGSAVLDVACGPGDLCSAARDSGALPVGLDVSAEMIEIAHAAHPEIRFVEGDAEQVPFTDGSFDAVIIAFGLLHIGRPDEALREAWRVLRPGGKLAFAVWAPPARSQGFQFFLDAIREFGTLDVAMPEGPPVFRFSDPEECRRTLAACGFSDVSTRDVDQVADLAAPDDLFGLFHEATVRNRELLNRQTTQAFDAIRHRLADATRDCFDGDRYRVAMPSVVTGAMKP
jgi:ubiquinone/menaquinone biosynthesis C-methylase UbiE